MLGGAPIFLPTYAPQPYYQAPAVRQPARPPLAQSRPPQPPATARGVRPEDPPPSREVRIPTPEELGLAPARSAAPAQAAGLDWGATRARLQGLGAVSFFHERLPAGGYRFRCWLPRPQGGTECLEGSAASEGEAVRLCLDRAARWKEQGR
jgi:hypothetical protein